VDASLGRAEAGRKPCSRLESRRRESEDWLVNGQVWQADTTISESLTREN
jgi:hypothetical protein